MKKSVAILIVITTAIVSAWVFLFTTYFLTCKSYERFDNAKTKMTFPFICNVKIDNNEWQKIIW